MSHPAPPPLASPGDIVFPDCLPSLCKMLAAQTRGTLLISDLRKNKLPLQPSPLLACCSPAPSICSAQSLCCSLFSCQLGSSSLLLLSTPPREKGEESALIAWRTEHKLCQSQPYDVSQAPKAPGGKGKVGLITEALTASQPPSRATGPGPSCRSPGAGSSEGKGRRRRL